MFIVTAVNLGKMVRYQEKVIVFPSEEVAQAFIQQFHGYALYRTMNLMDVDILHDVMTTKYKIELKPDFLKDNDIILFENL